MGPLQALHMLSFNKKSYTKIIEHYNVSICNLPLVITTDADMYASY